jgi:CRP/FNR family transcriptional regulator, anaerobic regulatory protein
MRPATLPPHSPFAPFLPMKAPAQGCQQCRTGGLCLACALRKGSLHRLDSELFPVHRTRIGEYVYHQGQKSNHLHVVRTGTLKTTIAMRDGREQVSGFYMAGDILGPEDLAIGWTGSTAMAIENSQTCAIDRTQLDAVAEHNPDIRDPISHLLSLVIVREHGMMVLLGTMSAEERLTMFLLNISRKMEARGYSASDFILRMSRAEIGSYLGLTLESVSRSFSSLHARKVLQVERRHVRISNLRALTNAFQGTPQ